MQKFDTPTPITAILDIPAGHIRLIAADRTDTTVEILPADPTKNRDVKAAEQTTTEYRDGTLRIKTTATNQLLGPSGSLEVTIQLPADSHLQTKAASADLRAVGRLGDVTVETAHGPIKLDETTAAHLTTLAGDITVGRLTGPADITTAKGDIRITQAVRGTLTLRTEAGNISIDTAPGVSATLDAGTSYGRIHNALNNTEGTAAQLTIHATTAYGDITARSL
ncbi:MULTISPECIES: DUF4097 family beta strand repeat-containing protein [Streptosporangium]|uniref:DUF4097 and DUF4098 domain-containing protein YvlB n=1 Tax=Streptosporangium brasiliense TaxID=47480 RepID=A0ABT9R622_9ACTN|nr:DUF4097 family beta strand repeat-containing protein [Streptosporangium brasiliense]MDP9864707.1 DUF4097 and DUF4098 domain-containing protein YvlB [Streptosporangium brasiliense]